MKPIVQYLRSLRHRHMIRNYDLSLEPDIPRIKRLLKPGDKAIDIGACIGLFTYNMAMAVGEAGSVIACEPLLATFDVLERNMRGLGMDNVITCHVAMSDSHRMGKIHVPKGKSHYFATIRSDVGEDVQIATFDDDMMTLTAAAFIKLDTEGCEAPILRGANNFLDQSDAVWLVEVNKAWWEIQETFAKHGYKPMPSDTENCFFARKPLERTS